MRTTPQRPPLRIQTRKLHCWKDSKPVSSSWLSVRFTVFGFSLLRLYHVLDGVSSPWLCDAFVSLLPPPLVASFASFLHLSLSLSSLYRAFRMITGRWFELGKPGSRPLIMVWPNINCPSCLLSVFSFSFPLGPVSVLPPHIPVAPSLSIPSSLLLLLLFPFFPF